MQNNFAVLIKFHTVRRDIVFLRHSRKCEHGAENCRFFNRELLVHGHIVKCKSCYKRNIGKGRLKVCRCHTCTFNRIRRERTVGRTAFGCKRLTRKGSIRTRSIGGGSVGRLTLRRCFLLLVHALQHDAVLVKIDLLAFVLDITDHFFLIYLDADGVIAYKRKLHGVHKRNIAHINLRMKRRKKHRVFHPLVVRDHLFDFIFCIIHTC